MAEGLYQQLEAVEEAFNKALVSNDAGRIANCIADDWVLVTPEAGPISRERFLRAVEQGVLSHDSMTKDIDSIRFHGNVAIVVGRGRNTGTFNGQPISADEWVTDIYVNNGSQWLCVLTHLTPAVDA